MKLYSFPLSTYSQKVLVALAEKGVECELEEVMLFDDAQRAKYREIYPLGKIPLLVLDDGYMIPESSIIVEYLDTHFESGTRLIPDDPDESRKVRFQDRMLDLYLNDPVSTLLFQSWKPESERDAELIQRASFRIGVMFEFMNQEMATRTWSNGDDFSLADCAAAPPLFYAQHVAPFDDYPSVAAYWERLQARPSYAAVLEAAQPHLEALQAGAA